jgi:hypothetical protein
MILFVGGFFGVCAFFLYCCCAAWSNRRSARLRRLIEEAELQQQAERELARRAERTDKRTAFQRFFDWPF